VKTREAGRIVSVAVIVAVGVNTDGQREVLGLKVGASEAELFWTEFLRSQNRRGLRGVKLVISESHEGIKAAAAKVLKATWQRCRVHFMRNSLDYASWKDRKLLAAALRPVYTAPSAEAALEALNEFERGPLGQKFPTVTAAWRSAWDRVIPFFAFPPAVRPVVYTTNAIESVHSRPRKIIKTRGHFPSDDAAIKLIWLALRNITADWGRAAREWREAMNQFAILYEERFTQPNHGGGGRTGG
jgi:putative transposase